MSGCKCIQIADDLIDTTECPVHPVDCEALHPITGKGCHHGPGHPGQHAYVESVTWPNTLTEATDG